MKAFDHRLPPMKLTLTASGSSFVIESRACVAWPLTSLMPNISEEGNDVDIFIFSPGTLALTSLSSSACRRYQYVAKRGLHLSAVRLVLKHSMLVNLLALML